MNIWKVIKGFFSNRALLNFLLRNPKIITFFRLLAKSLKDGKITPEEMGVIISALLLVFGVTVDVHITRKNHITIQFEWPKDWWDK